MNLPKLLLKDTVLLQMEAGRDGAIVIPEAHKQLTTFGRVIMIGTKCKAPLQTGDRVLCKQYVGTDKNDWGHNYRLYDTEDILAIIS
jgi:co-chaperonin GroES (HSP10)